MDSNNVVLFYFDSLGTFCALKKKEKEGDTHTHTPVDIAASNSRVGEGKQLGFLFSNRISSLMTLRPSDQNCFGHKKIQVFSLLTSAT